MLHGPGNSSIRPARPRWRNKPSQRAAQAGRAKPAAPSGEIPASTFPPQAEASPPPNKPGSERAGAPENYVKPPLGEARAPEALRVQHAVAMEALFALQGMLLGMEGDSPAAPVKDG
eukprot:6213745-Pleurochrysis_carterae.AAC.5